jgi:prepilin-type N-terminal cleavage/methylation domain-containing protein
MRRRGFTLIELMITIAILGIFGALGWGAVALQRQGAVAELERERALQLLEYQAGCLARGTTPAPATLQALSEGLPQLQLSTSAGPGSQTLRAAWRGPSGVAAERALVVLTKGAR